MLLVEQKHSWNKNRCGHLCKCTDKWSNSGSNHFGINSESNDSVVAPTFIPTLSPIQNPNPSPTLDLLEGNQGNSPLMGLSFEGGAAFCFVVFLALFLKETKHVSQLKSLKLCLHSNKEMKTEVEVKLSSYLTQQHFILQQCCFLKSSFCHTVQGEQWQLFQ